VPSEHFPSGVVLTWNRMTAGTGGLISVQLTVPGWDHLALAVRRSTPKRNG
jgi:hypothetical protein